MSGIPDVFWNPFQTMPLDFLTTGFYENRKKEIDERVEVDSLILTLLIYSTPW
jgi:hypothetical protein